MRHKTTLLKITPDAAAAVPVLTEALQDEDAHWEDRRDAAVALGKMGSTANAALPALKAALNDDLNGFLWVRPALVEAIAKIRGAPQAEQKKQPRE